MPSKLEYTLAGMVGLAASSCAMAGDLPAATEPTFRLAVIVSPHKTELSAPSFMASVGQLPKDHSNEGAGYYGFLGEANFGKVSLGVDYLTGTSNTVAGGLDYTPNSPTFNPLTHVNTELISLLAGYNVVDHPAIGKLDVTLGYFRQWDQPSISPANWFDGLEIGIKGRRAWDDKFALTYRIGYVPNLAAHGNAKDANVMTGKNAWNFRLGAEVPVHKSFSVVAGYEKIVAKYKFVVDDSNISATSAGFYLGGMVSF